MTRLLIVFASLAAALVAAGCGGGTDNTLTVPTTAYSRTPLPQTEPVRGSDHEHQALEGSIARWVQWSNSHYGKTVLDAKADNECHVQVEDLWTCTVTIEVVKPFAGIKAGRVKGGYTVTRDVQKNQMIYIEGTAPTG